MYLAKSGQTFVLRCHCGCYNLSFVDHGIELQGRVTCLICGARAEWQELLAEMERRTEPEQPDAQVHVLPT